jgi:hypothetical protein
MFVVPISLGTFVLLWVIYYAVQLICAVGMELTAPRDPTPVRFRTAAREKAYNDKVAAMGKAYIARFDELTAMKYALHCHQADVQSGHTSPEASL